MRKTTPTHEWIDSDGDIATVGITQAGIVELGEIIYVELPKTGMHVEEGQEVVVLESSKAAVDIYSPVAGLIMSINSKLVDDMSLINKKSESEGWLYKVKLPTP